MSFDVEKMFDTTELIDEIERLVDELDDCLLPKLSTNEWVHDLQSYKVMTIFEKYGLNLDDVHKVSNKYELENMILCCRDMAFWREKASKYQDDEFGSLYSNKRKIKRDTESDIRKQREIYNNQQSISSSGNGVSDKKQNVQKKFRKLWRTMIKKEMGKTARSRLSIRRDKLAAVRKAARECARLCRQKAMASNKCAKDALTRGRKLAREISMCWRQLDKEEKTSKKKADRILSEQKRKNLEMLEAKRQQRKLNYLITQTELYTHFMSKKMGKMDEENEWNSRINKSVDDEADDSTAWAILEKLDESKDQTNDENSNDDQRFDKNRTFKTVKNAVNRQSKQINSFSSKTVLISTNNNNINVFQGELKSYQEKGRQWLLNLFEQGINGILADEMGLGKTVQTLAFLATLAEKYDLWGPFLIVAPASTVHNWAQELARFVPEFRVVPYWGSVSERRILRRYWTSNGCGRNGQSKQNPASGAESILRRDSPYHIVVTSYQVVLQDARMVGRVRWQYLVLDEAHAIKNTASQRWSTLLSFECRNRLLLTGTPIQNTMQELWALLHFIMPTLFDSHEEFNDWFSRDIESQAAAVAASNNSHHHHHHNVNKSSTVGSTGAAVSGLTTTTRLTATQLSRLHLILQPFMLRRVKAEVENELPQKIEKLLQCKLSSRQQKLYERLKKRIKIDDLGLSRSDNLSINQESTLLSSGSGLVQSGSNQKNLLNLVMQLRKVCNHPDLIEPRIEQFTLTTRFIPRWFEWPRKLLPDYNQHQHFISIHCLAYLYKNWSNWHRLYHIHLKQLYLYQQSYCYLTGFSDYLSYKLIFPTIFPIIDNISNYFIIKTQPFPDHILAHLLIPPTAISLPIQLSVHAPLSYHHQLPILPCYNICSLSNTVALVSPTTHIADSAKLLALDNLLTKLKRDNHRVLIYSQMTRMIDIIEHLLRLRHLSHIRLDGSSRLSDRRDMVARFQHENGDIFAFLLSTRAGGLGINLTAADTVIFYDSDWNPTVDEQAMDRAHRLGQQRPVTVYRLVCASTVEQHMLARAEEKRQMQRMVIAGATDLAESLNNNTTNTGPNQPSTDPLISAINSSSNMGPRDVASLLLEDEEVRARLEQTRRKKEQDLLNSFSNNNSISNNLNCTKIGPSHLEKMHLAFDQSYNGSVSQSDAVNGESALQRKRRAAWKGLSRANVRTKRPKVSAQSQSTLT